jgi:hypothetical protein
LHAVYRETLELCARLGLPVLDFNAPAERERFAPWQWDDLNHLRSPECYRRMARALQNLVLRSVRPQGVTPA